MTAVLFRSGNAVGTGRCTAVPAGASPTEICNKLADRQSDMESARQFRRLGEYLQAFEERFLVSSRLATQAAQAAGIIIPGVPSVPVVPSVETMATAGETGILAGMPLHVVPSALAGQRPLAYKARATVHDRYATAFCKVINGTLITLGFSGEIDDLRITGTPTGTQLWLSDVAGYATDVSPINDGTPRYGQDLGFRQGPLSGAGTCASQFLLRTLNKFGGI